MLTFLKMKKDEVIEKEECLESNKEVYKQNQASDESNEMHFDEECECGKPNKKENFQLEKIVLHA